MESGEQKIKAALKQSGASATTSRIVVFKQLLLSGPISVSSLALKLNGELDRATVYRTVGLYEKLGIVNRIWHGFKDQVELSEIFTPHHHHAKCQNCGKTVDISSSALENALTKLSKQHQFLTINHSVELTGYCVNCQ